jgi:hypothetical protein
LQRVKAEYGNHRKRIRRPQPRKIAISGPEEEISPRPAGFHG